MVWGRVYAASTGQVGAASDGMASMAGQMRESAIADGRVETALIQAGDYGGWVTHNFVEHGTQPLLSSFQNGFETFPLLLIGMALYRFGLFDGRINARKQALWGWIGVIVGLAGSLAIGLWNHAEGLSFAGATLSFDGTSKFPGLPLVVGLAALLALWGPRATGWLGTRVSAAGRMAFSNYLGTSILMLFVFHVFALGLFGELTRPALYGVVLLTWTIMLAWSHAWLARFRFGPFEWLWRCLTYMRLFRIRRDRAMD